LEPIREEPSAISDIYFRWGGNVAGGFMSDDLSKKGPPDTSRVNLNEDWERRYWAEAFGVSEDELKKAVSSVGSQAEALRKHFRAGPKVAR